MDRELNKLNRLCKAEQKKNEIEARVQAIFRERAQLVAEQQKTLTHRKHRVIARRLRDLFQQEARLAHLSAQARTTPGKNVLFDEVELIHDGKNYFILLYYMDMIRNSYRVSNGELKRVKRIPGRVFAAGFPEIKGE